MLWVLGSASWGVGLANFPWKPEGAPFVFMSMGVVFFGISSLNSLVHNREPKHIFSEPWTHLVGVYVAWGFVVLAMSYMPLWAAASAFVIMVGVAVVVCIPIYRRAYLKILSRNCQNGRSGR